MRRAGVDGGDRMAATTKAARTMAEVLAGVTDPIVREKLVRGAAGRLGISDEALLEAARQAWQKRRQQGSFAREPGQDSDTPDVPQRPDAPRGYSGEALLVELVLCSEDASVRAEAGRVWARFENAGLAGLLASTDKRTAAAATAESIGDGSDAPSVGAGLVDGSGNDGPLIESVILNATPSATVAPDEARAARDTRAPSHQALRHP